MASSQRGTPPRRVVWYWPHPHRSGNDVATALSGGGIDVTIECLRTFEGETIERPPASYSVVADLPDVGRDRRRWVRALQTALAHVQRARRRDRLVQRLRPDVVHLQMTFAPVDALMIPLLRRHGAAVVVAVHDVLSHQGKVPGWLDRLARGRTYRAADGLIVLHPTVGQALRLSLPASATPVSVVPPSYQQRPTSTLRTNRSGHRRFLVFGAIRTNKGIDSLLAALRLIPDAGLEVVVAGTGDAGLESLLRRSAEELPSLTVDIGFASPERKAELFETCDVVLLPYTSSYTSFSAVLRDAYEWRRPVIASDVGVLGDEIRRDDTGWLVQPDDPEELARALLHVATADNELVGKATNVARGLERYSVESVTTSLLSAYETALHHRRGGEP